MLLQLPSKLARCRGEMNRKGYRTDSGWEGGQGQRMKRKHLPKSSLPRARTTPSSSAARSSPRTLCIKLHLWLKTRCLGQSPGRPALGLLSGFSLQESGSGSLHWIRPWSHWQRAHPQHACWTSVTAFRCHLAHLG